MRAPLFLRRPSLFACLVLPFALALNGCGSSDKKGDDDDDDDDKCMPDDQDGIIAGDMTFLVTVDDTAFSPMVLSSQNSANITLTLTNAGTKPHDFVIDCLPTPNDDGCPMTSCFPDASKVAAVQPGASATVKFVTPLVEGIYTFRSDVTGDTQNGQFIIK